MWQERLQPLIDAGKLTVIGVVQEQHPDRARLYKQWRKLSWPIAVDALNLLGLRAVPKLVALDESGVVRGVIRSPRDLQTFLEKEHEPTATPEDYDELSHETLLAQGKTNSAVARLFWSLGMLDVAVNKYRR